jgi:hypothetical protein
MLTRANPVGMEHIVAMDFSPLAVGMEHIVAMDFSPLAVGMGHIIPMGFSPDLSTMSLKDKKIIVLRLLRASQ